MTVIGYINGNDMMTTIKPTLAARRCCVSIPGMDAFARALQPSPLVLEFWSQGKNLCRTTW